MQISIARQLGLQPTTVGNFFMNARRRLHDKWQQQESESQSSIGDDQVDDSVMSVNSTDSQGTIIPDMVSSAAMSEAVSVATTYSLTSL